MYGGDSGEDTLSSSDLDDASDNIDDDDDLSGDELLMRDGVPDGARDPPDEDYDDF